jgi:hypothetical protein
MARLSTLSAGIVVAIALVLAACAPPPYDDVADKMLVSVQQQTDDGLIRLQTLAQQAEMLERVRPATPASAKALADVRAKLAYAANIEWYSSVLAGLTGLEARILASPDASSAGIGVAVAKIRQNVELFQAEHLRTNTVDADSAKTARQILDVQFKSLTLYQVTLKTGKKS